MLTRNFEVIPAIDVLEGRVVRLAQGRREAVTLEGGDPLALARRYLSEGATRLHLVDLDGAFTGRPSLELVERLASATELPLQVGGGYRTLESIADAIERGAERVMIGTAALEPGFLEAAADRFGAGLVVAIDVRDGRVAVDGWTRAAGERVRRDDVGNAELLRDGRAVAVVPVEQLEHGGDRTELLRALERRLVANRVDEPDASVVGERVRRSRHRLVDDPRKAPRAALVAESDRHAGSVRR